METQQDDFHELQREFKTFEARSEERYKTVFKQLEEVEQSIQRLHFIVLSGGGATLIILATALVNTLT